MSKKNIEFDRQRYKEALDFYGRKENGMLNPQYSFLRFEAKFEAGKAQYEWLVNQSAGNPRRTERYLKRNDLFIAKGLCVGIMVEADAKPGHGPVMFYPVLDSDALPAGYEGLANADAEALYNGALSIITGQTSNFNAFPLDEFRVVPQTQPVAMVNAAGTALVSSGLIPQWNMEDILYPMPERFVFAGTQDQKIQIAFPALPTTDIKPAAVGHSAYLVVIVKGWLVEGGTSEKFKTAPGNPYAGIL
jgi:hypothetical protein